MRNPTPAMTYEDIANRKISISSPSMRPQDIDELCARACMAGHGDKNETIRFVEAFVRLGNHANWCLLSFALGWEAANGSL